MFKIYQRYIASRFVVPFVLCCGFFIAFLLTFELFKITSIFASKGVELKTVMALLGYIALSFFPMAIPLSALFATVYTLGKMSDDSEVIALQSFGATKKDIFFPFMAMGVIIACLIMALGSEIIPYSKRQFKNTIIKLTSKEMLADIKPEEFFMDIPNIIIFAEKVKGSGNKLYNVFLHFQSNKADGEEKVIFARKGVLVKHGMESKWGMADIRLHLMDGNIVKTFKDKDKIEKILFAKYDFPILKGGAFSRFINRDEMRSFSDLRQFIQMKKNDLIKLNQGTSSARSLQKRINKAELEYWSRINTAVQCLLFIFIGLVLGIRRSRGNNRNPIVMGLIIIIVYYGLFFSGVAGVNKGIIAPYFAVLLPGLVLFTFGAIKYRGLDWN